MGAIVIVAAVPKFALLLGPDVDVVKILICIKVLVKRTCGACDGDFLQSS